MDSIQANCSIDNDESKPVILIVDEPMIGIGLVTGKFEDTFKCISASTYEDALIKIRDLQYHALFINAKFFNESYLLLIEAIRKKDDTIPVFAVCHKSQQEQCKKSGFTDCFIVPAALNDIKETIKQYLK